MSTNVTWNGTTYPIPAAGEVSWSALSNFLIALGNNAAVAEEMKQAIRVATTSPVTVSDTTDCVVVTDLGTPGAVAVNLPAGSAGRIFMIVDGKGDAATNNITIDGNGSEQINGALTYVISDDRGGVIIAWNGTSWTVVARFVGGSLLINPMATTGDMIYGGSGGSPTNLATGATSGLLHGGNGATPTWSKVVNADVDAAAAIAGSKIVSASGATSGVVDGNAQSFNGLKTFAGGMSSAEYVGTNPEVGGSSPFQLTSSHRRIQVISPASTSTVRLPATAVVGEVWEIFNRSQFDVTVTSSGGDTLDLIRYGYIKCIALSATPTAGSDWHILDLNEGAENSTSSVTTDTGTVSATFVYSVRRIGAGPSTLAGSRSITIWAKVSGTTTSGSPTECTLTISSRFCQSSSSFRTSSLGAPLAANVVSRLKVEESGVLTLAALNVSTGAQTALGASFDLRAAHGFARQ